MLGGASSRVRRVRQSGLASIMSKAEGLQTYHRLQEDSLETAEVDPSRCRTVVLIGRTGNGKSTCANVIACSADPEGQLFKESEGSTSETKDIDSKTVTVEWQDQQYSLKIVDTIGIGDTDLPHDEVLKRLAVACSECREGINAIFFVVGKRVTKEEADAWEIIWKVIFNSAILGHTTMIRSNFPKFMNPSAVRADEKSLAEQRGDAKRIISTVPKILHVDNPPSEYPGWEETRHKSWKLLMARLVLSDKVYKPPELDEVNDRISNHVNEKSAADAEVNELIESMSEARDELEKVRIQAAVAQEKEKSARAEIELVREMNRILKERQELSSAQRSGGAKETSCSVM